jgi:hypothetical protein
MTTQDAATIATSIDLASVAGHNLRALLLRLLDGDSYSSTDAHGAATRAVADAGRLALGEYRLPFTLTPLGREVAERLRPVLWRVFELPKPETDSMLAHMLAGVRGHWAISTAPGSGDFPISACIVEADASRIAALLTQDDLRAAKTYRTEPDQ